MPINPTNFGAGCPTSTLRLNLAAPAGPGKAVNRPQLREAKTRVRNLRPDIQIPSHESPAETLLGGIRSCAENSKLQTIPVAALDLKRAPFKRRPASNLGGNVAPSQLFVPLIQQRPVNGTRAEV